jgi:DNA-binding winged helix-turn-helix (wHTH) protein
MALRFVDCRLDLEARQLFRGASEVHLSPKAFELLKLLVEARPRALARSVLLERVWPGVFVSDASLARVVNEVRDGLGDPAERPRFIRTVRSYGYAFAADVEAEDSAPPEPDLHRPIGWLCCGAREFALWQGPQLAGRDPQLRICLASPKVSRQHAHIVVSEGTVLISDLESKNGTFVDGVRIAAPTPLHPGAEIRIGPFTLVFRPAPMPGLTETEVG